jgi:heat shock protein HslJ
MPATLSRRAAFVIGLLVAIVLPPAGSATAQSPVPELTSGPESAAMPSAAPPVAVRPEGTWVVTGFDAFGEGLREPRAGSTLTVSLLPAGRLEGETACGTYVGGYTVEGEHIRLAVLSRGVGPCGRRAQDEAFDLTQALGLATNWAPSATGLELRDDSGVVRVRLVAPGAAAADLVGEWSVEAMAARSGELVAPIEGTTVSISFSSEGQATGSTGCRTLEAHYSLEADRLVIAPISAVGLPCEGDLRRQDRRLLDLLDEVVEWRRDGERLALVSGPGDVLLEASAVLPSATPAESPALSPPAASPPASPVARPVAPQASPSASVGA